MTVFEISLRDPRPAARECAERDGDVGDVGDSDAAAAPAATTAAAAAATTPAAADNAASSGVPSAAEIAQLAPPLGGTAGVNPDGEWPRRPASKNSLN